MQGESPGQTQRCKSEPSSACASVNVSGWKRFSNGPAVQQSASIFAEILDRIVAADNLTRKPIEKETRSSGKPKTGSMRNKLLLLCTIFALLVVADVQAARLKWKSPSRTSQTYNSQTHISQSQRSQTYNQGQGGYPKQTGSYPSSANSHVLGNGPVGPGYNPGGLGHLPYGGHSPYGGQPHYNSPSMGGHYPSFGQPSYGSAFGSMGPSPQQTILLQQSSKPGIGQLAKEAFVYAGVSAGVNAAVNRLIPGGIYGTRGSSAGSSGVVPPVSHTEITYNNYYNNGTAPEAAAPAAAPVAAPGAAPMAQPAAQTAADAPQTQQNNPGTNNAPPANSNSQESTQNNPNPLGFVTSNDDLKKLTESLYQKEKDNNAFSQITMKQQGQKNDETTSDDASEPLLEVKVEAYDLPTVKAILPLHDNYELDVRAKEVVTPEERRKEAELLDKIMETEVMKSTMKFLAEKGYIPDDEYEFKDSMKRIWFSQFKRIDGDPSSSGFETVFLAEQFDNDILGLHNWIYYAKQEAAKKLNYLGYMKETKLGDKGAIIKLRSSLNGIVQPVSTLFVGTSPELEFALYTMCFFARPNSPCPVSLGGTDFTIYVSRINYFGKDILISAYPDV
nr:poly(U)-specific endoribonuclease homolog [Megalopta genalis]